MKICWFGIYDPSYARNKILIDGLCANNIEIVECKVSGRGIFAYIKLITKFWSIKKDYDYLYCAFPVHLSVFIAKFSKKPIVVDMLVSLHDTAVTDRSLYFFLDPRILLLKLLDIVTIKLADIVIVDTAGHQAFFQQWKKIDAIKIVPVGVHTKEFYPIFQTQTRKKQFLVQFHGSYIPLQGTKKIIRAAKLLEFEADIQFRFIGEGQEFPMIKKLAKELELKNVTFLPWMTIENLNTHINEADIVLGIFGDSSKAYRVVPNKLFQGMATKKAVITMRSDSIEELFCDDEVVMVVNDPNALANAILKLKNDKQNLDKIARRGYNKVLKKYNEVMIAKIFLDKINT